MPTVWNMTDLNRIQGELPAWTGSLLLRNGVFERLSVEQVEEALKRFAQHDWGDGHPEGEDNDANLASGTRMVMATYRATDWSVDEPFYIEWTPENYLQQIKSRRNPDPAEQHMAYTEVLTANDY